MLDQRKIIGAVGIGIVLFVLAAFSFSTSPLSIVLANEPGTFGDTNLHAPGQYHLTVQDEVGFKNIMISFTRNDPTVPRVFIGEDEFNVLVSGNTVLLTDSMNVAARKAGFDVENYINGYCNDIFKSVSEGKKNPDGTPLTCSVPIRFDTPVPDTLGLHIAYIQAKDCDLCSPEFKANPIIITTSPSDEQHNTAQPAPPLEQSAPAPDITTDLVVQPVNTAAVTTTPTSDDEISFVESNKVFSWDRIPLLTWAGMAIILIALIAGFLINPVLYFAVFAGIALEGIGILASKGGVF